MEINRNNTETQLEVAINVLLETLIDKSQLVIDTINESIWKLSKQHSNEILKCCCKFYNQTTKQQTNEQQLIILNIMERICNENITELDGDTVILINNFCIEIINNPTSNNENQMGATNILVAIGYQHHIELMETLLANLKQPQPPNRMILVTLNKFSINKPNGFVPYLKQIFDILLTTIDNLTGKNNDDYRQLLLKLIGNCCESLQEYLVNIETSNDQTIRIDYYQSELDQFFDIVFNWLQLHHNKVSIIEQLLITLSELLACVSSTRIERNYLKIFEMLLNLNQQKKYQLSTSLIRLLLALINRLIEINGQLIEQLLDRILVLLNNFIIIDNLDYEHDYLLLKQHNNVLRCYDCLNNYFTDTIIDYLLQHLYCNNNNNNSENNCLKSLIILTYLVQYSKFIGPYLSKILKNFEQFLQNYAQNKLRINRQLLKFVTILLLNRQIVDSDRYLEFLLKLSYNYLNDNRIESIELKKLIDNTLFLLTTTVEEYDSISYRLFVRYLIEPIDFNLINLRCLINLTTRLQYPIGSDLFVRLMLVVLEPLGDFRGQFILTFFKTSKFPTNTQQLTKYLEENYENFNQSEWFDLIVDCLQIFYNNTTNDFRLESLKSSRQYLNKFAPSTNNFLIKMIGIQLSCIKDTKLINDTLDYLLNNTKFTDFNTISAYSECLGYSSRRNLDVIIAKLQQFRSDYNHLKTKRFFKFASNSTKSRLNQDNLRYLLLTSYIEICNEQLLTPELYNLIETDILVLIQAEFVQQRQLCIRCLHVIADILHPNRNQLALRLTKRADFIKLLQQQFVLHEGSEFIELYPLILQTFLALTRLPPLLQHEQIIDLLEQSFTNTFNASAIYLKLDSSCSNKLSPVISRSLIELYRLTREIFVQNPTLIQFELIVNLLLTKWLNLKKAEQRLPCCETVNTVLNAYYDNYKLILVGNCGKFDEIFGNLCGCLLRRLFDSNFKIRKFVLNSIYLLLCIIKRNNGIIINHDYDKQLLVQFQLIEQQLINDIGDFNTNQQFYNNLIGDLIDSILVNLNNNQLIYCLFALIEGLLDFDLLCTFCCSLCLNYLIKSKGMNIQQLYIEQIIEKLLKISIDIKSMRTKQTVLKVVLNFTIHHPRIVSHLLLNQPLPYDLVICECWAILSTDTTLVIDLIDQFKKTIKQSQLYQLNDNNRNQKIINLQIYQILNALNELLKNQQLKELCRQDFCELFSLLLIIIGTYIDTVLPTATIKTTLNLQQLTKIKPEKIAMDALKQLLICCEFKQMANCLLLFTEFNNNSNNNYSDYLSMIEKLIENLFIENHQSLSWLVANFGPYIRSDINIQRITVIYFFGQLVKNKLINQQQILAENLLEILLDVNLDQCYFVRKLALDGLGNAIDTLNFDLIQRHYQPILSVLMNSLDYNNISQECDVILSGMLTFTKLLTILKGEKFSTCQVTTVVRIKPLFDQDDDNLRDASIHLFGDLTLSLNYHNGNDNNGNIEAFREQIHNNLITLLLHLNDSNLNVRKSCKYTLRHICQYLENTPKLNQMLQEHLIDDANLHYDHFIKDIVKIMAEELQDLFNLFIMTCLSYLKSQSCDIRCSAVLIIGLLYHNLLLENRNRLSIDNIYDKLVRLLNDEHEDVRMRTVQSIAYLFVD